MTLKERAKRLKKDIPALFLALSHPKTPTAAKILAALTVGYALSPVDLVPDFIPVLGYLDDVLLLPAMVTLTIRLIPQDILEECREKGEKIWSDKGQKRWYYAIPVVLIWLAVGWLVIRKI